MPVSVQQHPELRAPVAQVIVGDDGVAQEAQEPGKGVANDRAAQVADVHRLGDVGGAEVDDAGPWLRDLSYAETFILCYRLEFPGHPLGPQTQIDEPRAGDLWFFQLVAEVESVGDFLSDFARLPAESLGEAHGAVGLIVPVLGILRWPDHSRERLGIGDQRLQGGAKFVLNELDKIHAWFQDRSRKSLAASQRRARTECPE